MFSLSFFYAYSHFFSDLLVGYSGVCCLTSICVGGQSEALGPWQRSWGRRLDICKGGIEAQESPWKSSNIYPHNQSLPTLLLCALTYTSDFTGDCPPPPLLDRSFGFDMPCWLQVDIRDTSRLVLRVDLKSLGGEVDLHRIWGLLGRVWNPRGPF